MGQLSLGVKYESPLSIVNTFQKLGKEENFERELSGAVKWHLHYFSKRRVRSRGAGL